MKKNIEEMAGIYLDPLASNPTTSTTTNRAEEKKPKNLGGEVWYQ